MNRILRELQSGNKKIGDKLSQKCKKIDLYLENLEFGRRKKGRRRNDFNVMAKRLIKAPYRDNITFSLNRPLAMPIQSISCDVRVSVCLYVWIAPPPNLPWGMSKT